MRPTPAPTPPDGPRSAPGRQWCFRLLTVFLVLSAGLVLSECVCRWQQRRILESDQLEPGMVQRDPTLGWRLNPGWSGAHRHHDFQVHYQVGPDGFRADFRPPTNPAGRPFVAVLGDSFTFGLGVDDDETFVHYLNQQLPDQGPFRNFAVPGYSTDQELLLLEQEILPLKPAAVWLVVYVANDLLDNQRPTPLQVRAPKPFFEWVDGQLTLRNSPVSDSPTPSIDARNALQEAVLGPQGSPRGLLERIQRRSAFARLLGERFRKEPDHTTEFKERFASADVLFDKLLTRMSLDCEQAGADLRLILMAGRSYVLQPGSVSAQYQEHFRQSVSDTTHRHGLPILDLAEAMSQGSPLEQPRWFHPHDGHLTPRGHRFVAECIASAMRREQ
ncbi:MAG: hypothetical protein H7A46_23015 [Verrucomicrobiales bacterium]|nr:hypothetical protein [Verrucomicrobiales bacterium]